MHGNLDRLPVLKHTNLTFLPAATNPATQPLENGIITALKCHYRRNQCEKQLDFLNLGLDNIYAVDQIHAVRWVMEA